MSKKVFPDVNEQYWYVDENTNQVKTKKWIKEGLDLYNLGTNNIFYSEKSAQEKADNDARRSR